MPELAQIPFLVELAPGNVGLKPMTTEAPIVHDGRVIVRLGETRAVCTPATRSRKASVSGSACCGGTVDAGNKVACGSPAANKTEATACSG